LAKNRNKEYCLNCGNQLKISDKFCPNCGQANNDLNVPIKYIFNDFVHDFINFDSKFFKTFYPLFFKPGFLTNEFVNGKRVSYVPPFRLYLICSFLFFAFISFNFDAKDKAFSKPLKLEVDGDSSTFEGLKGYSASQLLEKSNAENSEINIFLANQFLKIVKDDGQSFKDKFKKGISWMMFFLMPIFASILGLVTYKKHFFFIKHLVFSYHLHSFIFLVFLLSSVLELINLPEIFSTVFACWILFYMLATFRNVYNYTWKGTFFKLISVGLLYFVAMFIVILVTLGITALLL
jgi:hypothetical protein